MKTPATIFTNNSEAAHKVAELIASPQLTARPHNRFEPEFSEWYLYPKEKDSWPAYHRSKFSIKTLQSRDNTKRMFAGYYVEKGYEVKDPEDLGIKKKYQMQPDWAWHNFKENVRTSKFDDAMRTIIKRNSCPILISIDIHEYNNPPAIDVNRPAIYDNAQFQISSDNLNTETEIKGKRELKLLNTCSNLKQIEETISKMDLRFFWMNIIIGISIQYDSTYEEGWGAKDLWNRALEPWESLIK